MISIPAHFDGTTIVLDEPLTLVAGQQVRVLVYPAPEKRNPEPRTEQRFSLHRDTGVEVTSGEFYDEHDALHIDPLDAVPADFVRKPGSGAGEIRIADDFDETPDEFKDYM